MQIHECVLFPFIRRKHPEHQSRRRKPPLPIMPFDIVAYTHMLWQDNLSQNSCIFSINSNNREIKINVAYLHGLFYNAFQIKKKWFSLQTDLPYFWRLLSQFWHGFPNLFTFFSGTQSNCCSPASVRHDIIQYHNKYRMLRSFVRKISFQISRTTNLA